MALQFKQNGITHTVRPRHEALAKPDVYNPFEGPEWQPAFSVAELQEILACADRNTPNLYRIQQIMQPKQSTVRDLHNRVFNLRNDVNSSILSCMCRELGAEVADWARAELAKVGA